MLEPSSVSSEYQQGPAFTCSTVESARMSCRVVARRAEPGPDGGSDAQLLCHVKL